MNIRYSYEWKIRPYEHNPEGKSWIFICYAFLWIRIIDFASTIQNESELVLPIGENTRYCKKIFNGSKFFTAWITWLFLHVRQQFQVHYTHRTKQNIPMKRSDKHWSSGETKTNSYNLSPLLKIVEDALNIYFRSTCTVFACKVVLFL